MNENQLRKVMDRLLDDVITDEIDLWPSIQQHFKQNNRISNNGDPIMNNKSLKHTRFLPAILGAAVCLLLALLWLLTPQGQVWAQQVLFYFTRSNSDVLPLQSWQLTPAVNTVDPTPDPANILDAHSGIQEVQQQAGFDLLEPGWLPQTLTFSGASYDPQEQITRIFYQLVETNGLVIRQEPSQLSEQCQLCGEVGAAAAIVSVDINGQTGEYVEGTWNLTDNGPVWEPTPYLKTLRWKSADMAFELLYMGPPEALTQDDMVAIARSMK